MSGLDSARLASTEQQLRLQEFCGMLRSRKEIAEFLGLDSISYAIVRHVMPLVDTGLLRMTLPDKKKISHQRFVRSDVQ